MYSWVLPFWSSKYATGHSFCPGVIPENLADARKLKYGGYRLQQNLFHITLVQLIKK